MSNHFRREYTRAGVSFRRRVLRRDIGLGRESTAEFLQTRLPVHEKPSSTQPRKQSRHDPRRRLFLRTCLVTRDSFGR